MPEREKYLHFGSSEHPSKPYGMENDNAFVQCCYYFIEDLTDSAFEDHLREQVAQGRTEREVLSEYIDFALARKRLNISDFRKNLLANLFVAFFMLHTSALSFQ